MPFGPNSDWWEPETQSDSETAIEGIKFQYMDSPCFHSDDSECSLFTRAVGVCLAARARRMVSRDWYFQPNDNEHLFRVLWGTCAENTAAVLHEARSRGVPARYVVGGCLQDEEYTAADDHTPFSSAEEVRETGVQHYWAEIELSGEWWVVDPAVFFFDKRRGVPYVGRGPPEEYVVFPDSKVDAGTPGNWSEDIVLAFAPPIPPKLHAES